jgi:hypothetical protein
LGLSFQWEPFHHISGEILPLWRWHWREIALDRDVVPLDPDWDAYHELALRGVLHILTARVPPNVDSRHESRNRGALVGYCFNLVGPHNHYVSTRWAHTEMFWLDPAFRSGWQPVRFLLENLAGLKAREAKVATINFKLGFKSGRVGQLLARLGYEPTDIVMRRKL